MPVAGLRGSANWGTDERPKNFREMILWRSPNGNAPLTALLSRARSQAVDDPEFSWWEEELNPITLLVTGSVTVTTSITITIDSGNALNLVVGDVLQVGTRPTSDAGTYSYAVELLEVASVIGSTSFTVARGAAGTTPATIADDVYLTKIGNVFSEGTTSPDASSRNPTKYVNYAQIFKTAYRITETAKRTRVRTGDPLKNDKKRKMFDHSTALEYAFLYGRKAETTGSNGKPKRFTGGLLEFIASAGTASLKTIKVWTTSVVVNDYFDVTYTMWNHNGDGIGNERVVLAGNKYINVLNKIAKASGTVNYGETVKMLGMDLQRFVFPQGTLYVRSHPLMNLHTNWQNDAFLLDFSAMVYRYMRDTKPMDNIQANDADEQKGQWLTEAGLEPHHVAGMQYHFNLGSQAVG